MSWETLAWAKAQRTGSVGRKAVLMALAEYADERHSCFPSQETLAHDTEQSTKTVWRHLQWLEDNSLITRERRTAEGGHRTADRYVLPVAIPTRQYDELDPDPTRHSGPPTRHLVTNEHQRENTNSSPPTPPKGGGDSFPPPSKIVGDDYPKAFEDCWNAYPKARRGGKAAAYKAWRKSVESEIAAGTSRADVLTMMLRATVRYAAHRSGRDHEYTKLAQTFWGPGGHYRAIFEDEVDAGAPVPKWMHG
jgi:hypothetical protein